MARPAAAARLRAARSPAPCAAAARSAIAGAACFAGAPRLVAVRWARSSCRSSGRGRDRDADLAPAEHLARGVACAISHARSSRCCSEFPEVEHGRLAHRARRRSPPTPWASSSATSSSCSSPATSGDCGDARRSSSRRSTRRSTRRCPGTVLQLLAADRAAHRGADRGRALRRGGHDLRRRPRRARAARRTRSPAVVRGVPARPTSRPSSRRAADAASVPSTARGSPATASTPHDVLDVDRGARRQPVGEVLEGQRRFDLQVRFAAEVRATTSTRDPRICRVRERRRAARSRSARSPRSASRTARRRSAARRSAGGSASRPTCAAATSAASSPRRRRRSRAEVELPPGYASSGAGSSRTSRRPRARLALRRAAGARADLRAALHDVRLGAARRC